MDRGAWWATVHGFARVRHNLVTKPPKCVCGGERVVKLSSEPQCLLFSRSWIAGSWDVYIFIFSMCVLSHFSHIWLCNPMDYSLPGSSVLGILQGRILEWVAMPSSYSSLVDNVKQYSKMFAPRYQLNLDSQIPSWILPRRLRNIYRRET